MQLGLKLMLHKLLQDTECHSRSYPSKPELKFCTDYHSLCVEVKRNGRQTIYLCKQQVIHQSDKKIQYVPILPEYFQLCAHSHPATCVTNRKQVSQSFKGSEQT